MYTTVYTALQLAFIYVRNSLLVTEFYVCKLRIMGSRFDRNAIGIQWDIFVKSLEQDVAHNKEVSEQHYPLPSVMLCVSAASYLGSDRSFRVQFSHRSEDYSLGFNMTTRIFYYLRLSHIFKFTENICSLELTSMICKRQIRCNAHLRDKEIVGVKQWVNYSRWPSKWAWSHTLIWLCDHLTNLY